MRRLAIFLHSTPSYPTVSRAATLLALAFAPLVAFADPLSKKIDVDFFRDVPSRNLKGLATRSDGRLVAGPMFAEFTAPPPADILWCLEPAADATHFLVGTGPDGRIVEITFNPTNATFASREVVKLEDPQVFTVKRLGDGTILAGTSPKGALYAIRDGKPIARVQLPVDSIFDLLAVDDHTVLAATGNPGRIYRIDTRKFVTVGVIADKITDAKILADRGITVFGEIRDRNVRRLGLFADGRVIAGSSPKGNLYTFASSGGSPIILQENRDAEVTDLLPQPNGDLFAAIVFSSNTGESRVAAGSARPASPPSPKERDKDTGDAPPPAAPVEKFTGRSSLVWFPANGFPETVASRGGVSFYRLFRHGDILLMAGGDTGDLLGYDTKAKLSLSFPGSISAQLSGVVPLAGGEKFLLLRNNAPGFALLDFAAAGPREAETKRIDLATPAQVGAVRFNRIRGVDAAALTLEARVNNGSDEIEGWSPWTKLKLDDDGGWRIAGLRGRSAKLRITLPAIANPGATRAAASDEAAQLDRAALYALPQDRRPQLQDFRVLSPGYAIIPTVEQPPSPVVTLNQLLQPRDEEKHKTSFNSSQIVPQPGTQLVLWTINDPDGDNITSTFSLRREGDAAWTDVVTNSRDSYAQFDTGHMPEGIYFTRLVATEIAPRPVGDRLTQTFETDDLIVDHTPPEVLEATAKRVGDSIVVTVHGRDQLSVLDSIDVTFSNGVHESVEQPVDGIRDGRDETFALDVPLAQVSNATSVEVVLYDAAGNSTARRLRW